VAEVVTALDTRYPGLEERLLERHGALRRWINIFVDGADIRGLDDVQTALRTGAEVYIVASVAGGDEKMRSGS
jgi:molybdopterin synthase sulfur carrier subunit